MLEITENKNDLPLDTDLNCPICFENIDLEEQDKYGVPNCVICENGHRIHNKCFKSQTKHECPVCRNNNLKFCKSSKGYLYISRKGGKRRITIKKRRNTIKKRRNSIKKRRKTIKKKKNHKKYITPFNIFNA